MQFSVVTDIELNSISASVFSKIFHCWAGYVIEKGIIFL